jgi:hypothetical protein
VSELQRLVEGHATLGFEVVQEGSVLTPVKGADPRLSFAERVDGFDIHLLGRYGPPKWISQFENRLFEDEERWVHLRKDRVE